MNILLNFVSCEITVKKSRFLAELFPCESQEEARKILKTQKAKYKDARHVVHAFVIGKNAEILGSSDDGEPSGTAGRPILDVLKGSNCSNVMLTVTRWFGGILLGTGGLVKAYGDAAKKVISVAQEENAFEEYVEKCEISIKTDYGTYQTVKHILEHFSFSNLLEQFDSEVVISFNIPLNQKEQFSQELKNATNGKLAL